MYIYNTYLYISIWIGIDRLGPKAQSSWASQWVGFIPPYSFVLQCPGCCRPCINHQGISGVLGFNL